MTSGVTMGIVDHDAEKSTFGFRTTTLTAGNFAAQMILIDAIQAAVDAIVREPTSRKIVNAVDEPYTGAAADPDADREAKWRCIYTDNVNPVGNGSFEIPCPDKTLRTPGTSDLNLGAGVGAALKTAVENGVVSRLGNAVTLERVYLVGRNV